MSPWQWLGELDRGQKLEIVTGSSRYPLTDEQRQFIVLACKAFDKNALCKRCGGLSWDIPLAHYCQCDVKAVSDR